MGEGTNEEEEGTKGKEPMNHMEISMLNSDGWCSMLI
jgi:hypothetical protein